MNNTILNFIIQRRYWQKAQGIAKGRWRVNISAEWLKHKKENNIESTAEEFVEAWEFLDKK